MDNRYMVTLKASDGESMDTHQVTVTNMDEQGVATLPPGRPAVSEAVTTTLSDPDGGETGESWQWARSGAMGGPSTDISDAASASYTTTGDDNGMIGKSRMIKVINLYPYDQDNRETEG